MCFKNTHFQLFLLAKFIRIILVFNQFLSVFLFLVILFVLNSSFLLSFKSFYFFTFLLFHSLSLYINNFKKTQSSPFLSFLSSFRKILFVLFFIFNLSLTLICIFFFLLIIFYFLRLEQIIYGFSSLFFTSFQKVSYTFKFVGFVKKGGLGSPLRLFIQFFYVGNERILNVFFLFFFSKNFLK